MDNALSFLSYRSLYLEFLIISRCGRRAAPTPRECGHGARQAEAGVAWPWWWKSELIHLLVLAEPSPAPTSQGWASPGTKNNFLRMMVGSLSRSFRRALTGGALHPTVLVQKRLHHEGPTQDLAVPPHLSAMSPPCRIHPLPALSLFPMSHSSPVAHKWTFQTHVSSPTSLPSPSASSWKTLPVDTLLRPDSTTWSVTY